MTSAICMPDVSCRDERPWQRTRLHAPSSSGSFVAVPPLAAAREIASGNHERLAAAHIAIQGRTLAELRQWTRERAIEAAGRYTHELLAQANPALAPAPDVLAGGDVSSTQIFVSGHQPALFHAGVWVKNFVVNRLARSDAGIGLNLVVDNDAFTSTVVRVPAGPREAPRFELVSFDAPRPAQPWEESRVVDVALFESFPSRVRRLLSERDFEPLLAEYWPPAVQCARRSGSLVDALTAARAQWEQRWGSGNLELPISHLCRLEPFFWFISHLLAHLPHFHGIYNEVLREFRAVNRLRSRTHPVSDLRSHSGWLEAPFWIWKAGAQTRGRVFARQVGREVLLSDGRDTFAALPLSPTQDACCAVEALKELSAAGLRLRTRALTTTLFSRLCLADLFVHGLGGAKYDEMTDRLMARFFGLCAPGYLMLSGTLHLPLDAHRVERADELRLRRQLRELEYHSEQRLPARAGAAYAALVKEKQRLIAEQHEAVRRRADGRTGWSAATGSGYDRFHRLQTLNRELAAFTRAERLAVESELSETLRQLAANVILKNRDYPACLQPADALKHFIDHVCSHVEP